MVAGYQLPRTLSKNKIALERLLASHPHNDDTLDYMRRPIACVNCRLSKRRCVKKADQTSCTYCVLRKTKCSRDNEPHTALQTERPLQIQAPVANSVFEEYSEHTVSETVRLYLNLIHDRPHSLFHTPTLWTSISRRCITPQLLLSICAIGSRLSTDQTIRATAKRLTEQATVILQAHIGEVCIENVQAYILLANICAAELEPRMEATYFSIANRMAQILGLHRTDPSIDVIQQEIKSRTWWTLIMADNWCSAGLGIPRQLALCENDSVRLPIDERQFQRLVAGQMFDSIVDPCAEGLWAQMIRLVNTLGPIHDLNRTVAEQGLVTRDVEDRAAHISSQLDGWLSDLPGHLQDNIPNLEAYKNQGFGGPFVALHLGYHHYSTLLYFRYLDSHQVNPEIETAKIYAHRCRWHATSISRLLKLSRRGSGCEALYATVGHMTVVSSSVLLHVLLTGEMEEMERVRCDLLSNFQALIELKDYWPCLQRIVGPLPSLSFLFFDR